MIGEITFTNKAETRALINQVVESAKEAVCSTMGPNGNYIGIIDGVRTRVTKDGVSVAKALYFNETRLDAIAKLISEPAIKTDIEVGDGTTTTIFMMCELYKKFNGVMTFTNVKFLDMLVEKTVEHLNTLAIPGDIHSEVFRNMLMTTSNYEEEIVDRVLKIYRTHDNPNIVLQERPALPHDEVELNHEIYVNGRYAKDSFRPRENQEGKAVVKEGTARVVIIDDHVGHLKTEDLLPIISVDPNQEQLVPVPTVIFARNFDPQVSDLITGLRNNGMPIIPFELEASGSLGSNIVRDLCELLGVSSIHSATELKSVNLDFCKVGFTLHPTKVTIDHTSEHVIDTKKMIMEELTNRYHGMDVIARQSPVGKNVFDRISRLSGNNVVIKITGTVPAEAKERYYRYEDAMRAARTGVTFGVVPGIGWGYLNAAKALAKEIDMGNLNKVEFGLFKDYLECLEAPYKHLTDDTEYTTIEGTMVVDKPTHFLDLVTGEVESKPSKVYDNAAATMTALKGGWATAKTLAKLNNVMGSILRKN